MANTRNAAGTKNRERKPAAGPEIAGTQAVSEIKAEAVQAKENTRLDNTHIETE